jgi:hypothetical protein
MKKLLTLTLLLVFGLQLFADDALVLPAGVIRPTFNYNFNFFDKAFDTDGEKGDTAEIKAHVLGTALEFGVTDQISAAVQWAPAYIFKSEIEGQPTANINGFADLFIGAKTQIIGSNGFVKNDNMRLAAALGAVVPLNNYDGTEEAANILNGDDFTAQSSSNEAFGIGARLYYDYIITSGFYVNFYTEFIKYFKTDKSLPALAYVPVGFGGGGVPADTTFEFDYGYELTLELEPNYTFAFNEGNKLSVGVPFTAYITPDYKMEGVEQDNTGSTLLSIAPSVNLFTTALVIPMDIKVQYSIPVYGVNANASNTLIIQWKLYAKLY